MFAPPTRPSHTVCSTSIILIGHASSDRAGEIRACVSLYKKPRLIDLSPVCLLGEKNCSSIWNLKFAPSEERKKNDVKGS